jgi:hypothetical protein
MKNKSISKLLCFPSIICLSLFTFGCSSQGDFRGQRTDTGVSLAENNYKIIKAGAKGESQGFSILFFSIISPNYAEAKAQLYSDVGQSLLGRSVALANQTEDESTLNLIIFSIPKVTITADIIEFTSKSENQAAKPLTKR